jgi:hypothetical protein
MHSISKKMAMLLGTTAAWLFGLVFVMCFFNSVWGYPLASLPALAGALLLLPPVYSRIPRAISAKAGLRFRVISSVVLFMTFVVMYSSALTDESRRSAQAKADTAEQTRKSEQGKALQYFKDNKSTILTAASSQLEQGKVDDALLSVAPYRATGDADLNNLAAKIDAAKRQDLDKAKTAKLVQALEGIKPDDVAATAGIYAQLASLHPESAEYKKQRDAYQAKADEIVAKQKQVESEAARKEAMRAQGLTWQYSDSIDQMSQKTMSTAHVQSMNRLDFDFPYNGVQRATLQLRKHPRWGTDVILSIQKGQFLCNSYDGCSVSVRFGNGKPQRFSASEPDDNSSNYIFIRNYSSFVSQMRKVDQVVIEAKFYQEGNQQIVFTTDGLGTWR